ncbi:MAG: hypothetical protein ACR2O1_03040 [Boseongicola sp.]
MSDNVHDQGSSHLPPFITAPNETDVLFVGVVVFVILLVLLLGVLYLKLHSIPEQMAHSSNHTQFQLVAVLALLALFTHNNIFWIAALLLATIQLPNYEGLLASISKSLREISDKVQSPEIGDTHLAELSSDEQLAVEPQSASTDKSAEEN